MSATIPDRSSGGPTIAEVDADLIAPGQPFELVHVAIQGRTVRAWKHAPANLRDVLLKATESWGANTYTVLGDERVTYAQHLARVAAVARRLTDELGVRPGDRVAIAMRNYTEFPTAFWAAVVTGAVAVPLNSWGNGDELAFAIEDSGAKVLIADGERLARLAPYLPTLRHDGGLQSVLGVHLDDRKPGTELPDDILDLGPTLAGPHGSIELPDVAIAPDDDVVILYTSGTTGRPKGVVCTHRNLCSCITSLQFVAARTAQLGTTPPATAPVTPGAPPKSPVVLLPVPLFHATGLVSMLISLSLYGATFVLMRKWDPTEALDLIERERITGVSGVPTMLWDLVNEPSFDDRDLSSVTSFSGGGAATPPEFLRRLDEKVPGTGRGTGWGMTETSSIVSSIGGDEYRRRPTSCGVPVPVSEVRIVDENGADVPEGESGEIWVRGANVIARYWNRPEETAATITDGWLHSGDIARFDEDGYLYIVDRLKDLVIRGGENISSAEVERALYEHPDILEVAVFGAPHEALGEEVGAVVRLRPGSEATTDALRAYAASSLAGFKVPTRWWLWDEPFPVGGTGKVLKRELRATALEQGG